MLLEIWNDFLYQPLFNWLIWVYNNWTDQNFGWAIVYVTVMLRTLLLPFTLINEFAEVKNRGLNKEVERLNKELANDPILKKEEIRRVLKTRKVYPWAKVVVLGIQGLVLVLLYQVFVGGLGGENILSILYQSIEFPGKINTLFLGFDLKETSLFWSALVAGFLMVEVYIGLRQEKRSLNMGDLAYFVLFPTAIFIFLYILPMVKALFVFTSILFSAIVHLLIRLFVKKPTEEKADEKK